MSTKPDTESQRWSKHLARLNDHRKRLTGECCEVTGIVVLFIVLAVAVMLFVVFPGASLLARGGAYFVHVTATMDRIELMVITFVVTATTMLLIGCYVLEYMIRIR